MKKDRIILIILVTIFISFLAGCSTKLPQKNYIKGLIIDKSEDSFVIMNDNDTIYQINNNINIQIGEYVGIEFFGELDYLENSKVDIKYVEQVANPFDNDIMKFVKSMSVDEKIGQLIMAKVPNNNKVETIENFHVSGYIFFARDIGNKTVAQIQNEINTYQNSSKIPMLIAIDEEGGTVSRISGNKNITEEHFKSPQELYNAGGFEEITKDAIRKRDILVNLGFNVNYAPVIDVVTDTNAYMYQRSFGKDAKETALFATTILKTQSNEMTYTFKHFPGYGNNKDTHITKANDNRSLTDFDNSDFIPYKAAIENGAKQIMVSHNIVNLIDDKPSSLSLKMHNILRERLGFKGIIITDSLSMSAITQYESNPYVEAVKAGNNLLITANSEKTFSDIKKACENGIITNELLDRLVYRVIELKKDKGLI